MDPLSAGDGRPVLMRQAGKESGKMGEIRQNVELVNSWEELFDTIREDYNFLAAENVDTVINVIRVITGQPGTTVLKAMNILEDARRILLEYQTVC